MKIKQFIWYFVFLFHCLCFICFIVSLKQVYIVERLKSSFRKFYGRYGDLIEPYGVTLSRMLNDILTLDQQWLPYRSDFSTGFHDLYTECDLHRIMSGFHGAFATGVVSQQGTLTLPDTWFRPPFWDLLMLQLLRPNSSNLSCLYSTFHIEYPLVLSRFCFIVNKLLTTNYTDGLWDYNYLITTATYHPKSRLSPTDFTCFYIKVG